MDKHEFNRSKMESVISFFLTHANNTHLGKTKLMKLLYYADFDHFERYDEPITGATYKKRQYGPLADEATSALDDMVRDERVRFSNIPLGHAMQHRFELLEEFNPATLSATEVETLHLVVDRWLFHTKAQIVAATHGEAPWLAVREGESIPYELAYYRNNYGEMDLDEEQSVQGDLEEVLY
jgi:uncharacterized phage-associated protein